MEYLVETKGNVEEQISKVYSISAKNKNEAEIIARKQFKNENGLQYDRHNHYAPNLVASGRKYNARQ